LFLDPEGCAKVLYAKVQKDPVMRPRTLPQEEKEMIRSRIAKILEGREEILFAYLYGSFRQGAFRDIDVAVYLRDEGTIRRTVAYETSLEQQLEKEIRIPADVRVLNGAPLTFVYSVIRTGEVILSRNEGVRSDVVCRVLTEYHDFAYYRERYRREALGLLR
jgi:uncharacterized protein